MTKYEMTIAIAEKTGVEHTKVRDIVQLTLDGIIDVLASEGRLELRDFGVFEVRKSKPRVARNPRTGEQVHVGERSRACFKAGREMALRVDGKQGS